MKLYLSRGYNNTLSRYSNARSPPPHPSQPPTPTNHTPAHRRVTPPTDLLIHLIGSQLEMLQGLQVHGVGHGPVDAHGSAVDGVSVFLGDADATKVLGGCLDVGSQVQAVLQVLDSWVPADVVHGLCERKRHRHARLIVSVLSTSLLLYSPNV